MRNFLFGKVLCPQRLSLFILPSFFHPPTKLPKDVKECLLVISTQDVGNFSETQTENIIKKFPTAGG